MSLGFRWCFAHLTARLTGTRAFTTLLITRHRCILDLTGLLLLLFLLNLLPKLNEINIANPTLLDKSLLSGGIAFELTAEVVAELLGHLEVVL